MDVYLDIHTVSHTFIQTLKEHNLMDASQATHGFNMLIGRRTILSFAAQAPPNIWFYAYSVKKFILGIEKLGEWKVTWVDTILKMT